MSDDKKQMEDNLSTENKASKTSNQRLYITPDEYFVALEKWIHDAYMWQNFTASFPYFLMCNQYVNQFPLVQDSSLPTQVAFPISTSGTNSNQQQQNNLLADQAPVEGIECRIPSLWKRLLAEFLDFLILFFFKLSVILIAVDFFELIDLSQFDFDALQKDMKLDYKVALQVTHNVMILEMFHRVVVCIFETFWLIRGVAGRIGGSTPGKSLMGLRVVRCESVTPLSANEETVLVQPGTDLGFGWAFTRSFVKNLIQAFFIPASFAFLYFRFNRASYDMICNTIVIEEPVTRYRPHRN